MRERERKEKAIKCWNLKKSHETYFSKVKKRKKKCNIKCKKKYCNIQTEPKSSATS